VQINRIQIKHAATTGFAILTAALALIGSASSRAARLRPPAHTARSLNGTATAHLHLARADGEQLYEEGPVAGALPGWMRAVVSTGSAVAGSFDISTRGGRIYGRGTATPHGSGRYRSFSGTLTITGGSGRYVHANGHAGLYGVFDRRTYALEIQTTGRFSY
jgi:hypothetical protein